ncbi:MAG TPA: hypothetical protein PLB12_13070, partial [Candidatus Goldiibacteriota bacterium]|nr:hypothetical protein [Candidatus Goldiibacteriota bacterium]
FAHVSTTYKQLNVTPWGETEAVISTIFQTTNGAPELPFIINKKTIIRGNKKWFATIYYITNNGPGTAVNIRFFQGCDWNFNGSNTGDNCRYENGNGEDTVFGYKPAGDPVSYGGFSGSLNSANHDVGTYTNIWAHIRANLLNANSAAGDAATALEWNLGALTAGQKTAVDVIWGYGNTLNGQAQTDMQNEINYGKSKLFDAGISGITSPVNGAVYQNSTGSIIITATAVNYGLRDWVNLPVRIEITGPSGYYRNSTFTTKTFTVPDAEQHTVECPFDISTLAQGEYTIKIYTDLNADMGYADSNSTNDGKTVKIYIGGVSALPESQQTVNIGQAGDLNLTVSNTTGADDRFDISLDSVTMPWPGYLIDGA